MGGGAVEAGGGVWHCSLICRWKVIGMSPTHYFNLFLLHSCVAPTNCNTGSLARVTTQLPSLNRASSAAETLTDKSGGVRKLPRALRGSHHAGAGLSLPDQRNDDIDARACHPLRPGSSRIITRPDSIFNSTSF